MNHLITTIFSVLIVAFYQNVMAQGVGIGTSVVESDAVLQLKSPSNNQGLLIPSMTTGERTNGWAATSGVMVYDTTLKAFFYFDGTSWIRLIASPAKLDVNMDAHKITNLSGGTNTGDAVNKGQLDVVDTNNLDRDGTEAMTGNLNMGARKITNLAQGTSNADAVTALQLNRVSDNQAKVSFRTINDRTTYPSAIQRDGLRKGGGAAGLSIFVQNRTVTNNTSKTKRYFCAAFLSLTGSGEGEDVGVGLFHGNTMFASWRRRIAEGNGEDDKLYTIMGEFTLRAGQSTRVSNQINVFDDDIRVRSRGMFCISDN